MLERNTTSVDVEAMVATGAQMHPREAVQHLTQAIFEATGGVLNDDATAMCLDWHGGPARDRTSELRRRLTRLHEPLGCRRPRAPGTRHDPLAVDVVVVCSAQTRGPGPGPGGRCPRDDMK